MAAWKLDIVCRNCGYVAASAPIGEGTKHDDFAFRIDEECPACQFLGRTGKAPATRRPSRFRIWREARAFRRQLEQGDAPHE